MDMQCLLEQCKQVITSTESHIILHPHPYTFSTKLKKQSKPNSIAKELKRRQYKHKVKDSNIFDFAVELPCLVSSCLVYFVLFCLVLSCLVMFCLVWPGLILSNRVCLALLCLVLWLSCGSLVVVLSCLIFTPHPLSHPHPHPLVLSCLVVVLSYLVVVLSYLVVVLSYLVVVLSCGFLCLVVSSLILARHNKTNRLFWFDLSFLNMTNHDSSSNISK